MNNRLLVLMIVVAGTCAGCATHGALPGAVGPKADGASSFVRLSPDVIQGNQGSNFTEILSRPNPCQALAGGIAVGPDNTMWYFGGCRNSVIKIDMMGLTVEYSLTASPRWMTLGPDHNMWVTLGNVDEIAKVTPAGFVTYFAERCSNANTLLEEIAPGADGNLWFTISGNTLPGTGIGRITPAGVVTCFPTSRPDSRGITAAQDGNVWFTEPSAPTMLGRITPAGVLTEFPDPAFCVSLVRAGDGNLYCGALSGTVRIDPQTASETMVTPISDQRNIAASGAGANAELHYVNGEVKLATLHLKNGQVTRVAIPQNQGTPRFVAFGPDGNLWYTANGQQTDIVGVNILRIITVTPSTVNVSIGQSQPLATSETHYPRSAFASSSSNTAIATVAPSSGTGAFTVTGVSAGSAVVTIADDTFNSIAIPVTVH